MKSLFLSSCKKKYIPTYHAVQKLPPENGHIMISGRFIDQIKLEVISSFLYNYGIHASLVF